MVVTRLNIRLVQTITGLLLLVFIYTCYAQMRGMAEIDLMARFSPSNTANLTQHNKLSVNIQRLMSWRLFGQAEHSIKPISQQQYQLTGILLATANTKQRDKVIIRLSNGQEKILVKGSQLPNNAKILRILADKVIIIHKGQQRSLILHKE